MTKIIKENLKSELLQRDIPYRVILPKNYETNENRYPVLYLLHGLFGSCENWLELTNLKDYVLEKELIIILVDGENGWYSDSKTIENNKFESYFLQELMPEIENLYRTIPIKEKRAIAGLSMGGYGALKFCLKKPDLFVFAGSMSGAFDAPNLIKKNCPKDWKELLPSIEKAFGETNSRHRIDNDLFQIIEQIPTEKIAELPHFYLDCGVYDSFLETNRKLTNLLKDRKIPFEYYEISGGHDWDFWDQQIKKILEKVELVICN